MSKEVTVAARQPGAVYQRTAAESIVVVVQAIKNVVDELQRKIPSHVRLHNPVILENVHSGPC